MFFYLGGEVAVSTEKLVGLFDLDNTSWSYLTRQYLSCAETSGLLKNTAEDIPRSFAVLTDGTVILTQPTTGAIARRLEK